ncbi:hypothetical protein [Sphingobacterium mizutaii]|uniref:hypothetical protein n=1 Tax=Sphingobacterium mizutaii TaxID=1010 RepID=UPI00162A730B|nr:hypothetical protein [Sphingobacterium mizutaii]
MINDYLGEIEYYKLNSDASVIDRIGTSEGYLLPSGSTYTYHYNLTEHLGNVRSVLKRGATATAAEVVQKSDYYASGKRHANSSYAYNENRYLFNGKELQDEIRGVRMRLEAAMSRKDSTTTERGSMMPKSADGT